MSQIKTLNGVQYTLPSYNDTGWGANTGNVLTQYMAAIADVTLQLSGGSFTLTADTNFGATFGLVSAYFKSRTANIATAGVIRLANTDLIDWRNTALGGNLALGVNTSDQLTFNGTAIAGVGAGVTSITGTSNQVVASAATGPVTLSLPQNIAAASSPTFAGLTLTTFSGVVKASAGVLSAASLVNADVSGSAAIAYSKLTLTGSIVNADINSSAAIAYSKLTLTGSIVNADVNASAAIAYSKLTLTGSIVNADINASAAIAYSKLNLATSIVNGDIAASTINLTQKVTGTLPIANGGTNTAAALNNNRMMASGSGSINELAAITGSSVIFSDANGLATSALPAISSMSPTFTGYSSISGQTLYYWKIGKLVYCNIQMGGTTTSNATTFTMTLPYIGTNSIGGQTQWFACSVVDNSVAKSAPGMIGVRPNAAIADIYLDWQGTGWTASGAKYIVRTSFCYMTD